MAESRPGRTWRLAAGLLIGLLGGCQPPDTPARITADNYRTAIPDPKTLGETYVSDPDRLLAPGTIAGLNARLDSLDHTGRAHIDVVLVRSIGEAVPKTAAYELFNLCKIGDAKANNGLLLLLVEDHHRIEFETGYGLEADLPDAVCGRIQREYMVPAARAGHYDAAVEQGVAALIRRLRPAAAPQPQLSPADSLHAAIDSLVATQRREMNHLFDIVTTPAEPPADGLGYLPGSGSGKESTLGFWVVGVGLLALYVALAFLTARGSRRGWPYLLGLAGAILALLVLTYNLALSAGQLLGVGYLLALGYMHGYFGWLYWRTRRPGWLALSPHAQHQQLVQWHHHLGFTAFLFPVLLALYWYWHQRRLRQLRDAPPICPTCHQPMRRLSGEEEKSYLAPGQQAEEALESVDYDLWQCPACATFQQLVYPNRHSSARPCPACRHRTLMFDESRDVRAATTSADGWGWRISTCRFCHHQQKVKYTIPRQTSSGGSSSWSGSSSSSSSSSGSSSGSSSSGGSSGGGGAGSSW